MKRLLTMAFAVAFCLLAANAKKPQYLKITVVPQEASITVNGSFAGYGYAEVMKPEKKNQVLIIKCECNEYKPIIAKFFGGDKRESISYELQQDGFYRSSAASGIVNKFFTIDIDPQYYTRDEEGNLNTQKAWKMLHQILLNYFDEISASDYAGGYLQTPWHYKEFSLSEFQLRNRVTIRDISNGDKVAFQIKVSSEVAGAQAARHGEFTEIDRIPKDFETIIQELQTRIGKVSSL